MIVFLACCFEHASSLYPPYHQLPFSPTVLFHSSPWHHLSYTVKTSVPAPAGLPPTLSPTITHWFRFSYKHLRVVCAGRSSSQSSKMLLSHPWKLSEQSLIFFFPDTCNQLRTGKWLGYGQKRPLPVVLTNTFRLFTWIYLFSYV